MGKYIIEPAIDKIYYQEGNESKGIVIDGPRITVRKVRGFVVERI